MATNAPPVAPADTLEEASSRAATAERSADSRRAAWSWLRIAGIAVSVYIAYQLLVVLEGVLSVFLKVVLYLVFGAILSFILGPLVELLHRYVRVPRTLGILLALLGFVCIIGGVVALAAGPTVSEAHSLADQIPDLISRANGELQSIRDQLKDKGIDSSSLDLNGSSGSLSNRLSSLLLTTISGTLNFVVDLVIVFVVAFWLLKDGPALRAGILSLLPAGVRVNAEFALDATAVVVGGYVRAQLFLAVIIGTLAGVGCAIIGVPFPIVVALAAGIFELIPIVGPFVGGGVAILLALTVSFNLALATLILFIVIHVIEGYVLGPRIQAKFVRLHPLVSLLALFAGIDIGGFLGALFAVPLASLAAVFIRAAVGDFRAHRPELYATRSVDLYSERRRQRILGEFRLFKSSPLAIVRGWLGRGAPAAGTAPPRGSRQPAVAGIDASPHEVRVEQEAAGGDPAGLPPGQGASAS